MDLGLITGILIVAALIAGGMTAGGSTVAALVSPTSLLFVVLGGFAIALIRYGARGVGRVLRSVLAVVFSGRAKDVPADVSRLRADAEALEFTGRMMIVFGAIGANMALVIILGRLDDLTTIGSPLAVAILSPFYGILFHFVIFQPLAGRLRDRTTKSPLT